MGFPETPVGKIKGQVTEIVQTQIVPYVDEKKCDTKMRSFYGVAYLSRPVCLLTIRQCQCNVEENIPRILGQREWIILMGGGGWEGRIDGDGQETQPLTPTLTEMKEQELDMGASKHLTVAPVAAAQLTV
ncbi:uncharacterized protein PADG_12313 [Paracoccidioides brasiliensis Pb18]|uniref:Uncharacterized protein n=1 Tax=Paracoccidioides brasiliensis (strain Pb18) TaxID=502780 RepID=A0A0A0HQZ9_PARBD|nr:uncharacterized protein PADG_12313 [Paracoccidioides brasiliensis Pb18]KGM91629.1 hypothetical protein PADG_12313 [Paracoccidioides brasiliensis Pb18]